MKKVWKVYQVIFGKKRLMDGSARVFMNLLISDPLNPERHANPPVWRTYDDVPPEKKDK